MKTLVRGFWAAREDSIDETAVRITSFLEAIRASDERLAEWTLGTPATTTKIETNVGFIRDLLSTCRLIGDDHRTVYWHLGFALSGFNQAASFQIHCGATSQPSPNRLILRLYEFPWYLQDYDRYSHLVSILQIVALSFNPDWGDIVTEETLALHSNYEPLIGPAAGLFLSNRRGCIGNGDKSMHIVNVPERGAILYTESVGSGNACESKQAIALWRYIREQSDIDMRTCE